METIIIKEEPVATSVIGPSKPARAAAPIVELAEGESYDIVAALARAKAKRRLQSAGIIKTEAIKAEGGAAHCVSCLHECCVCSFVSFLARVWRLVWCACLHSASLPCFRLIYRR